MTKLNLTLLIGAIMLLSAFTIYTHTSYKISDNFNIHFAGADAEGNFEKFKGEVAFNENELDKSNFSLVIEVESISTGNWLKNRHSRSEKWFDTDKYPTISFKSTKFYKTTNGYAVDGLLTIHGIQKEVTIPFTFSNNIFKGNFKVNRIDYGVGTMEGMSKTVSNEIKIDFSVPVIKK
jgi:polyisoprenoid-binding protein YceI